MKVNKLLKNSFFIISMTKKSDFEKNFINYLNESIDTINSSQLGPSLKRIKNIIDVRDGIVLAQMVERFETACGRRRKVNSGGNPYQFVEEWLVTIGNMSYIPNYGKFIKNILEECKVELIANIFGIMAMTMYNNRIDLWQKLNVELIFLLLGEPLIPKIGKHLKREIRIEKDEKLALIIENRQLHKQLEELNEEFDEVKRNHQEEVKKLKDELHEANETHERIVAFLNIKISKSKQKFAEMENKLKNLEQMNVQRQSMIDSLKSIINDGETIRVVDTNELFDLKKKVTSMQNQIKELTDELDLKFG